ncbi:MAG TPA: M36 family metallopeptidase [Pyrinomonadaceae bacterium]|nr:M36 family metallopeptidase [Pyrinomonadaceae bacterium]
MIQMKSVKAKADANPQHNVPRRIYDIEAKPKKGTAEEIAVGFLKKIAPDLKIESNLKQLKLDTVKESILGKHVLYQQYHDGTPITGAWVRVDINDKGEVYNVMNDLLPETVIAKIDKAAASAKAKAGDATAPQLTADDARQRALDTEQQVPNAKKEVVSSELVFYPHDNTPTLAWKVIIRTLEPYREYKIYLDASSGGILDKISLLKEAKGTGKVFDPHPVATLNDTSLEDNSTIPQIAYRAVSLENLTNNSGHLDGKFVSTKGTNGRVKRADLKFDFERGERAFKEVMVYFHIDRVQRHIQSLGFNNINNRQIEVNIDGTTADNSFYSPVTKSLTFGTGGVDDAEDAEIILHEYGHSIQDNQVAGFGPSGEARAMGEGFGDFLAASFFADMKPEVLRPTLGNWDAVAYSGAEPPCLRRLDSNKKYPKDLTGEEHDDGEIWSACLWELRGALGRTPTEQLVFAHHFLLTPKATFEDAAKALITADKQLNQGRNEAAITDVFVRRGILPNPKRKNKRAGEPFQQLNGNNRGK